MQFERFLVLCLVTLAVTFTQPAGAQTPAFPTKPIRIVVPFPPGGGADLVARLAGAKVSEQLGQPVIIENRPRANTILAAEAVAKAPNDGYTLLLAIDSTLVINPHLHRKLPYDPQRDFTPVALLSTIPLVLVAHPSVPAASLAEFIQFAKAQANPVFFGAGVITTQLAGELFNKVTGTKLRHVPYKGGSTIISAVLGARYLLRWVAFQPPFPTAVRERAASTESRQRRGRALRRTFRRLQRAVCRGSTSPCGKASSHRRGFLNPSWLA
jgi:tripartite-type tricarboxylate transporter receptor subunit TctC